MAYDIFKRKLWGGDLDKMIDFQNVKQRDLWYIQTEVMKGDLDEMIDFQKIQSRDICHFQTDFNGIQ